MPGGGKHFEDAGGDLVNLTEVGAHALEHDLAVDVDHVRVTDAVTVDHFGHLHARAELPGLRLNDEQADLARGKVIENYWRHVPERAGFNLFEDPDAMRRADGPHFVDQARGDFLRGPIGDDGDFLLRLDTQANAHGVARAGRKLRVEIQGGMIPLPIPLFGQWVAQLFPPGAAPTVFSLESKSPTWVSSTM